MKKMTIVIVVMLVMAVFMPTHAFAGSKDSVAASYGYDDDGRYSVNKAYSLDGKFLREVGGKVRE
jgi:hypothetical protein